MLMAHPAVLDGLLSQYEHLRSEMERAPSAEARRRLDDVVYTLCVSTGTRSIDQALPAAERHISASGPLTHYSGPRHVRRGSSSTVV